MEDDIDIEEHDVLDNPRIRTIFPDIAQIKAEIPDDDYHDSDHQMEYQPYSEAMEKLTHHDRPDAESARFGNKIILGSKPTSTLQVSEDVQNSESVIIFGRKPVEIKQEIEECDENIEETHHEEELHEEPYDQAPTVLILGSKPSSNGVIEPTTVNDAVDEDMRHLNAKTTFFGEGIDLNCDNEDGQIIVEEKDPTTALVLLENWGPRLENSSSYCKECEILFATSNTLLAHNMVAHSFLVALDKNKAIKSTSKLSKKVPPVSGKFCNHCNKMFPDSNSLINHLYHKLTFDKNNAVFKTQPKKVVGNPFNKQVNANLVKTQKVAAESTSRLPTYAQGAPDLFRCEICTYYCERYGVFLKHMQFNHKAITFSLEKEVFDGVCTHCGTELKSKENYNKHIARSHDNFFNLKGVAPVNKSLPKKQPINQIKNTNKPNTTPVNTNDNRLKRFQCQLCSEIFIAYTKARQHREAKHPESKTQNIFKRIANFGTSVCVQKARIPSKIVLKYPKILQKGVKNKEQVNFLPSTSKSPQKSDTIDSRPRNQIVVPKSTVFKCNKCQIHFTSCAKTVLHTRSCAKQKGEWKCNICDRQFQSFDQAVHIRQHQVSQKFNVVVYQDNICLRVLNQCPHCKFCFHEKEFYLHVQKNVCKGGAVNCEKCSLPIHTTSVDTHTKWHERIKITKKNVILVEFSTIDIDNKPLLPAKRAIDLSEDASPAKKAKKNSSALKEVLYCQNCRTFLFRDSHTAMHKNGKCRNTSIIRKKKFCNVCGLTYTSYSHQRYHRVHPDITLMDMKFISMNERRVIAPPIPDFPGCKKCKVHFCKKYTVLTHNCKDSYKTCKQCLKKYSDLAYKLHMRFHEYHRKFIPSQDTVQNTKRIIPFPEVENIDLPEFLKKYEMLTDTWNILFLCDTCNIVCDSYDRAVEHSQNHFNLMESYDMIIQHCVTCDLKFDGSCFERHAELHAQNKSITKGAFTVLEYTYEKLLASSWLEQFHVLPPSQLQQILSRSIYNNGRSVKLRVVQDGPPDSIIYRCGQCEAYIHPLSLTNHYKNVSCSKDSLKYFCKYCRLPFCSPPSKEYHQKYHKTCKSFKVVYFNEDGDEEFNAKLRENDRNRLKYSMGPTDRKGKKKGYHFYRCEKCNCCIGCKQKMYLHKCARARKKRCNICQLYFHNSVIKKHMKTHEFNPMFTRKNIKCTVFRNKGPRKVEFVDEKELKSKELTTTVKLLKCPCGLHFTSTKSIEKHLEVCGTDTNIAKEKCSKCKRLFDTTQLVTHLCKHHSKDNDKNTEFEVICVSSRAKTTAMPEKSGSNKADKRKDLFKCRKCNVYYLTKSGLAYHLEKNHQVSKIKPCPYCQLKFMPQTLEKHISFQHKKLKCKLEDFNVYVEFPNGNSTTWILDLPVIKPKRPTTDVQDVHRDVDMRIYSKKLYKCKICHMHFLTKATLFNHKFRNKDTLNHTPEKNSCPECEYTFGEFSLLRHQYVHHEIMKLKREDFRIICPSTRRGKWKRSATEEDTTDDESADDNKSQRSEGDIEKETKQNVRSAKNVTSPKPKSMSVVVADKRNIFKCYKCDIYYLSEGGLAYHFETNHDISKVQPCPHCKLTFMPLTLRKHVKIQHQHLKYNLEDFVIYIGILNENNKVKILNSISADEPKVNGNENTSDVNETSLKKSPSLEKKHNQMYKTTSILFKCGVCNVIAFSKSIEIHIKSHSLNEETSIQLESCHCGLIFHRNRNIWKHKKIHHTLQKLSRNDLYVITMNSYDGIVGSNHIFKCEICEVHLMWFDGFMNHVGRVKHNVPKKMCPHCGLVFSMNAIDRHIKLHHNIMKLNIEDLVVLQSFGKSKVKIVDVSPTYHNKDQKELMETKHNADNRLGIEEEESETEEFTENDEDEYSSMPEDNNAKKRKMSEDDNQEQTSDTETKRESKRIKTTPIDNNLYQCDKCQCCFMTITDVQKHYGACRNIEMNEKCDKCQLMFHESLNAHKELHHSRPNLKLEDLVIIIYPETKKKKKLLMPFIESLSPKKLIETTEEISMLNANLYRCGTCSLHFLVRESLILHTKNPELTLEKSTCTFCGLEFSNKTLPTHIYIHHKRMKLTTEDFIITSKDENMDDDCAQGDENMLSESLINSTDKDELCKEIAESTDEAIIDSKAMVFRGKETELNNNAKLVQGKGASVELTVASADSLDKDENRESEHLESNEKAQKDMVVQSSSKHNAATESEQSNMIKLYKCATCNVCFLSQVTCYKHAMKHAALDSKDYIECKLCGYQFLILNNSLHKHITKHHNRIFKPEEVLIEEYHPDVLCHGTPKIDIYFGTDKLQSKLVTTTTDAKFTSDLKDDERCGKTNNSMDLNKMNVDSAETDVKTNEDNNMNLQEQDGESDVNTTDKSRQTDLGLDRSSDIVTIESSEKGTTDDSSIIDLKEN